MSETDPVEEQADGQVDGQAARTEAEWRRRRRLAEVFGDVLPETTSDERDGGEEPEAGGSGRESGSEAWLRAQVPPHHG